jgi:hypothetical protein
VSFVYFLLVIGFNVLLVLRALRGRRPLAVPRNLYERIQRLIDTKLREDDDEESVKVEFRVALVEYGIDPNQYELTIEEDEVMGTQAHVRRTTDGQTWTLSSFDAYLRQAQPDSLGS